MDWGLVLLVAFTVLTAVRDSFKLWAQDEDPRVAAFFCTVMLSLFGATCFLLNVIWETARYKVLGMERGAHNNLSSLRQVAVELVFQAIVFTTVRQVPRLLLPTRGSQATGKSTLRCYVADLRALCGTALSTAPLLLIYAVLSSNPDFATIVAPVAASVLRRQTVQNAGKVVKELCDWFFKD